jgi:alkanesulfonate monooxygenase SsuD/methylene tetrahydromethanopterin reductase-like flavin-dependent oxidoreductase (luciferase family)
VPSTGPIAGALTQIVRRAPIALLAPLVSINNPVRVAEEIAMLDQLSGGRLVVLLLRGTPSEFKAYEPIDPALTQERTQAATRLVRKALTDTVPFAWQDEFFNYPNIAIWPRPLRQPLPPMYFSGNSLNSAEFAARERLGLCISFHRPEAVAAIVTRYRAEARRCGWEPMPDQIVYRGYVLVADTDTRADQLEAVFSAAPPTFFALRAGARSGGEWRQKDRGRRPEPACGCHTIRHGTDALCGQPGHGRRASAGLPFAYGSRRGGPRVQFGANP